MSDAAFDTFAPEVRPGFLWEPVPDGCLLFEESTGKLLTLNAAAEIVLTHADGQLTVIEICATLEHDFQIPAPETRSLLQRLMDEGVLLPQTRA